MMDSGWREQERKSPCKNTLSKAKKRKINLLFRTISSVRLSFSRVAGKFATTCFTTFSSNDQFDIMLSYCCGGILTHSSALINTNW